jgi:hypothetical protein
VQLFHAETIAQAQAAQARALLEELYPNLRRQVGYLRALLPKTCGDTNASLDKNAAI